MSEILTEAQFEALRFDYAQAVAQTEREDASSYDDEEKALLGAALQAAYGALRAENERLREALENVILADYMDEPPSHSVVALASCPSCIARAALAAPKKEKEESRGK